MDGIVWGFAVGHALFVGVAVFRLSLFWSLIKQAEKILYLFLVEMAGLMCSIPCCIFLIRDKSERDVALFHVVITIACSALTFLITVVMRLSCLRVCSPDLLLRHYCLSM